MRSVAKLLARISQSQHINNHFRNRRPLSTTIKPKTTITANKNQTHKPVSKKDSLILESFRRRKLQGTSPKTTTTINTSNTPEAHTTRRKEDELEGDENSRVVSSFEELGLKKELIGSVGRMGVFVPSEIQCVGIPAVLEGKSLVLSSDSGSGRSLAYLLPLLQLLRRDEAVASMKAQHPRAVVLCSSEAQADQGFHVAKFISDLARSKSADGSKSGQSVSENASGHRMGLLIGTPAEIIQQMEDGSIVTDDVRYLVLDEADNMFELGFGVEMNKIMKPLKCRVLRSDHQGFQSVLVTSSIAKVLGNEFSPLIEKLEKLSEGKVSAMMLEMNPTEIFDILESTKELRGKLAEAVNSLTSGP